MVAGRALACLVVLCSCVAAFAQIAGQNINMVSGTNWPAGDPYLQRQNEPSIAVSSRNAEHMLGGANDYRTVDIPNPNAPTILGDAWLGVYSSMDGGETWKSTLLPGYPQDTSAVGKASPLHSYTVATDPTVRAGTHGLFYYSGLVFNRGTGAASGVFVATFQDLNNKGNGDVAYLQSNANGSTHGNPFQYIGVSLVDSGTSGQFLDKPWIAVDIPRPGRTATCKINGQTISSGYVYIVYTQFNGSQNNPSSKIKAISSSNCGATWSPQQVLSNGEKLAQGTVAAIDPTTGNVYIAWRQLASGNQTDSIQYATSTDGGNSFHVQPLLYTFAAPTTKTPYPPGAAFDQPQASSTTFRSLDVPSMAVDGTGRVWVAYSQRFNGPTAGTYGSRIMITTLPKGSSSWTAPYVADSTAPTASVYGHQFMPSLNFAYGKMMLAWFDSRRDNLQSVLQCANPPCSDLSKVTIADQPIPGSTISNPATVFTPLISDPNSSGVRHTIDVYGGVINPAGGPATFKGFQISQYPYYVDDANGQIEQGFFNPPNLPMFVQGTTPFVGDYIDIAAQSIMPSGNSWAFNTQATDATGATNAPDFHVTWTDNRDVVPPPVVNGSQDWTQYVPPNGGNQQLSTYSGTGAACPTCLTVQPACNLVNIVNADGTPGTSSYSGDRNQNVYTSRISNGLIVRFRENAKVQPAMTSAPAQRTYSLLVKNTTSPLNTAPLGSPAYYRVILGETSTSQGVSGACNTAAVPASFPGTPNCYLDVAVNPKTTLTEAINVPASGASTSINVLVAQIACIPGSNGCANTPSFVGLQAVAVLNGDASNPSLAEADFLSTDNDDPDVEAPYANLPIAAGEEYNPTVDGPVDPTTTNIFTPKISDPAIFTPKIGTVANSAPAIETPTIFTPKITSIFTPKITSVQVANPTIVDTIFTPKIFTPKIFTPKIVSPDIFTPKITNLTDNSLTDYSWKVNNKGNTSASYNTTELVKSTGVQCCPANCSANPNSCTVTANNPAGPNCSVCQLIQHKVYESPVVNRDSTNVNPTCDLTVQQNYVTVANVPDPAFSTTAAGGSPSNPMTSTLSLSPGEGNRVTLRVVAPPVNQMVSPFKTQATPLTPNTGQNAPSGSLTITTSALPVAVVGQNYTNTAFVSVGGFGATAWTIPPDLSNPIAVIPPPAPNSTEILPITPLTLGASGKISTSIVTALPGTYTVNVQVQDSALTGAAPTPALDVQQIFVDVNQFTIMQVDALVANEVGSTGYMKAGDVANVNVTVSSDGPANATNVVAGLTVNATAAGTPAGPMPVVSCGAPVPASAGILGTGTQIFNFACTALSGNGYVTFTASASGHYVNPAADVLATATTMTVPPTNLFSQVVVDNVPPTLTFGPTTTAQSAPGWYNTVVVVPYTTSDNLSGVASAVATAPATGAGINGSMTLTTEGKLVTGMMTVTDFAKNTAQPFTSAGFNIDWTPPTISGTPDRAANNYGWYNAPVTVTFICNDPNPSKGPAGQQSGIAPLPGGCTPPITLSGEGANQFAIGTAIDNASNSKQVTVSPINIDLTPPTVNYAAQLPNSSPYVPGTWTNQTVTITYSCTDALSGFSGLILNTTGAGGSPVITYASNTARITISGETSGLNVSAMCTDVAGNVTTLPLGPVMIDKTPPVLTVGASTPLGAYSAGSWTNQNVTVTYSCADNASTVNSGLAAGSPTGSQTFTQQTTALGVNASGSCIDQAGNVATNAPLSFSPVLIDTTPPTITATATAGGNPYTAGTPTNQSVVVSFNCTDALSGVNPGSITSNLNYSNNTSATYTANGSCLDNAGNSGSTSFAVLIDSTVPTAVISSPSASTYLLNQQILASYACVDNSGGDSVVTCAATPSVATNSSYPANAVGPATFSVHVVDQAGNATNPDPSASYLVTYKFMGFQAPLQNAVMTPYPPGSYMPNDSGYFAVGTTVPVAWELQDGLNAVISDPTSLTSIVAYPNATCTGPASGTGTTLYNSSTNTSWLSFANNTFTFNWNTTGMAVGCYNLVVTTNDTAQWSTLVHLGQTYGVGTTPYAIAFDGTNMWVPAYGSNSVTELQASTGTVVGTYPVGKGPDGVFFDGTNIWVANTSDNTVTKLATSGATLGTYPVGAQPWGIAFDGTNIWVTNRGSSNVTELAASTGALVGTYPAGVGPYGIAFDGTNMWVSDDYTSSVTKLSPNGTVLGTYSVGASPVGVAFDGTNIWVADQTGGVGTVTKLAPTGAVIGTYPAGPAPNDILFDGTNIWVTNNSSNTVTKLLASTGAIVGTYAIGTNPYGVAFDGANIWVTVPNNNSVTKLPVF